MKSTMVEIATHCLEDENPRFAREVHKGDFVVGGRNFGMGSSREQAAQVLKYLGMQAVIAVSFGGIFFRNAVNHGLPVLVCADAGKINCGDRLRAKTKPATVQDLTQDRTFACNPIPEHLLTILEAGGLVPLLMRRFRS